MIPIDERKGASVVSRKVFEVMGTLGILDLAVERGLRDVEEAFERLKNMNFRYRQEMLDAILAKHRRKEI